MSYDLSEHTWDEVRLQVHAVNPELACIIDQISPDDSFKLYIAKYKYGQIFDDGEFYLSEKSGINLTKISKACLSAQIKENLNYSEGSIPAGIVLNGAVEIYINAGDKIIPRFIYEAGDTFALWRKMDDYRVQSFHPLRLMKMVAGARSLFMLPNIGDYSHHKALVKEFDVDSLPPKALSDHWYIFKALVNHKTIDSGWELSLLLFSKKWVENINDESDKWLAFRTHILNKLWSKTNFWRNQMFVDFAFSSAKASLNLKPNPYLSDTLKHIITIIAGESPGFGIAFDNTMGPIKLIQDIYQDFYKFNGYKPIMLHPRYFNVHDKYVSESVYYSLQHPTTYEFSPKSKSQATTLSNLRELDYLTKKLLTYISLKMKEFEGTMLSDIYDNYQLDIYHVKTDSHQRIKNTVKLLEDDCRLRNLVNNENDFCSNGIFLRGCVRISNKLKK